jgi:tetratricopeptide (TPR) repeat protein/predicted Ser/Thr protein kinase
MGSAEPSTSSFTRRDDNAANAPMMVPAIIAERYVLSERLGEGGMARVHLAYDLRLQRCVAIKVLKRQADPDAEARSFREARAMAQLNHANVLPVHDVGKDGEQLYIVMDHVRGETLRGWLSIRKRTRAEVCRVFAAAARGLAAAHDASLIHRDFKPTNVMVAEDGRVLVMDFGLARRTTEPPSVERTIGGSAFPCIDDESLTETGVVMGTPAYMSPEQHLGEHVDARSDQYAFCVALFEALCGVAPFAGIGSRDLVETKLRGAPAIPAAPRLPGRLRALLRRGLARDPSDRHPSMTHIVAILERSARPHRIGLVVAGMTTIGATAFAAVLGSSAAEPCRAGEARLADVWDDGRREAVTRALQSGDNVFAGATTAGLLARLDKWRERWLAGYVDACEATHVRGEQSAALLDRRMACLDKRRAEAHALVTTLADGPELAALVGASDAAAALPSPDDCSDAARIADRVAPPAELAERVAALQSELELASASETTGQFAKGKQLVDETLPRVEQLGHTPLLVDALLVRARIRRDLGEREPARDDLERAYSLAIANAYDDGARAVAVDLTELYADYLESAADARRWSVHAGAWSERSGTSPAEHVRLQLAQAAAERLAGDFERADTITRAAITFADDELGADHPLADRARNLLGIVLSDQTRFEQARALFVETRDLRLARLGPDHPRVAQADNNIASTFLDAHDYEGARPWAERAVAGAAAALGDDHPEVAGYLVNLALAHEGIGDDRGAANELRRALEIQETTLGPKHTAVGRTLLNLGGIVVRTDGPAAAVAPFQRARDVFAESLGADHPHTGMAEAAVGSALHDAGRLDDARPRLHAALDNYERSLSSTNLSTIAVRMALTGLEHEAGRHEAAARELDALLACLDEPDTRRLDYARVRFETAKLVWEYFPDRRDDARGLVRVALAAYDASPDSGDPHAGELRAWAAAHDVR